MVKLPLSRNIRFVEALAFLSLVYRGLPILAAGQFAMLPTFALPAVALLLMLAGLAIPLARRASWLAVLVCGLTSVALWPFEADGLLWILAAVFSMFHGGWFSRRPRVISLLTAGSVVVAQVTALFLHPADRLPLGLGFVLADAALGFLIHTFRHDLLGTGAEYRPLLRLADYRLTERELQVVHLIWGGRVAKEISHELRLGESTVRKDLSSIYHKLGVVGAKELYVLSHSHRIVLGDEQGA